MNSFLSYPSYHITQTPHVHPITRPIYDVQVLDVNPTPGTTSHPILATAAIAGMTTMSHPGEPEEIAVIIHNPSIRQSIIGRDQQVLLSYRVSPTALGRSEPLTLRNVDAVRRGDPSIHLHRP